MQKTEATAQPASRSTRKRGKKTPPQPDNASLRRSTRGKGSGTGAGAEDNAELGQHGGKRLRKCAPAATPEKQAPTKAKKAKVAKEASQVTNAAGARDMISTKKVNMEVLDGIDPDEVGSKSGVLAGVDPNGRGWYGPLVKRSQTQSETECGTLHFEDFPEFVPNMTPKEVLAAGSFGGGYFRDIYSDTNKTHYSNTWEGRCGVAACLFVD